MSTDIGIVKYLENYQIQVNKASHDRRKFLQRVKKKYCSFTQFLYTPVFFFISYILQLLLYFGNVDPWDSYTA